MELTLNVLKHKNNMFESYSYVKKYFDKDQIIPLITDLHVNRIKLWSLYPL